MSFPGPLNIFDTLQPDELTLVQRVYDHIVEEPWVAKDPELREELARYILGMYDRGLRWEQKLYAVCIRAAKAKFTDPSSEADPQKASDQ